MNSEWIPCAVPALYLIGAGLTVVLPKQRWRVLAATTVGALVAAAAAAMTRPGYLGAAAIVLLLIAVLGWIIGDYSRRYLDGEPGQGRFVTAFLGTLASVSAVVASWNLAALILAWSASSAGLHVLLTFYRDRPAAIVVAHKKFLASRLAEMCLIAAAALLYREWHTLNLDVIAAQARSASPLPPGAAVAATLVATAVLLKCAQLPLHGWLIQVMEAPTPVSALLHAGVVNLGGFVLIRLAPLINASPAAQALLVIIGSLTAVLAGLVMLTRVTVKVRLAWSTCSQMGLMVLECGLGLYDLALLHLLAHSVYKAHAFLSAGGAVQEAMADTLMTAVTANGGRTTTTRVVLARVVLALPSTAAVMAGSAMAWHAWLPTPPVAFIALALLSCGLATLLWTPAERSSTLVRLGAIVGGTQLYLAWHWLIGTLVGVESREVGLLLNAWTLCCFVGLYLAQAALTLAHQSPLAARLYRWVYAGFYLDERFTRLTFRIWPVRTT